VVSPGDDNVDFAEIDWQKPPMLSLIIDNTICMQLIYDCTPECQSRISLTCITAIAAAPHWEQVPLFRFLYRCTNLVPATGHGVRNGYETR
jgi:hypothetical protein